MSDWHDPIYDDPAFLPTGAVVFALTVLLGVAIILWGGCTDAQQFYSECALHIRPNCPTSYNTPGP